METKLRKPILAERSVIGDSVVNAILSLLLLSALATMSVAATNVSGLIVNGTWTQANSPYNVVGDIDVAGLTIQPGVQVVFQSNYNFEVDGVLKAVGTASAPIVFSGTNARWNGIYFNQSSPGSVLAHCSISNSTNSAIRINKTSPPALQNCLIAGNSAPTNGGGIYAALATNQLLDIEGCVISNNVVNPSTNNGTYSGGGVFVSGSCKIKNCVVQGNSCLGNNGYNQGGGIYSDTGRADIENCVVSDNVCSGYTTSRGGGIHVLTGSIVMTNSIIFSNSALSSAGFLTGGGIYLYPTASVTGASFVNCTIAYNNIEGLSSASGAAQVMIMNSILYFNNSGGTQIAGATNVTYCDVENGFAGTSNISFNPIFLSATNVIIVAGSPCINAGNTSAIYTNVCFPPSLGHLHNDMGAHGGRGAGASMEIEAGSQAAVSFFGGVPGYNYQIQGSTDFLIWQTLEQVQFPNLGQSATYLEPLTNTLPCRFYRLNVAQ